MQGTARGRVVLDVPNEVASRLAWCAVASVPTTWALSRVAGLGVWHVAMLVLLLGVALAPRLALAGRVALAAGALMLVVFLPGVVAACTAALVLGGVMALGGQPAPAWRRALWLGAPVAGLWWYLALVELARSSWAGPAVAWCPGILVYAVMVLAHLEVQRDVMEASLRGSRLHAIWLQVAGALDGLPASEERQALAALAERAARAWCVQCDEVSRLTSVLGSFASMSRAESTPEGRHLAELEHLRRVEADTREHVARLEVQVDQHRAAAATQEVLLRRLALQAGGARTREALRETHAQLSALAQAS